MIRVPSKRIIRPGDKPPFSWTQRFGLRRGHWTTNGLVGYWLMNESGGPIAYDLSGNGNHGTLNGNAYYVAGRNGPVLSFDNANDYVDFTDADIFSFTDGASDTPFSIVTSLLLANIGDTEILTKYNHSSGDNREWRLYVEDTNDVQLRLFHNDTTSARIGRERNVDLVAGKWYQIAATYDGSKTEAGISIFANAVDEGSYVSNSAGSYTGMSNTSATMKLGESSTGADFDGLIDYVYLYDRVLSLRELRFLLHHPYAPVTPRDSIIVSVPAAGGTDYVRTIDDSMGVTDTESHTADLYRVFVESMGVTDITSKSSASIRVLAEAVGITDAIVKAETKTLADSLGITDVAGNSATYSRDLAESLGLTDTAVRTCILLRTFAEALGIADATSQIAVLSRVLADAIGVTDEVTRTQDQSRIIADTLGLTDIASRGQIITFAETMGITDDVARIATYVSTQSDSIGIADSIVRVAVALRTISDDVGLTDEVSEELSGLIKAAWAFMIIRQANS